MSLDLKFSLKSDCCKRIAIYSDNTGTYNADTNPGGYGAPNPNVSAIEVFTINLYKEGDTIPNTAVFNLSSRSVTSVVVTYTNGTTLDLSTIFSGITYPFNSSSDNALQIVNTSNGLIPLPATYDIDSDPSDINITPIEDQLISITGDISGEAIRPTTLPSESEPILCGVLCCNQKQFASLAEGCCSGCNDSKIMKALKTWASIKTACAAHDIGQDNNASCAIKKAKELCHNCGCGC